MAARPKPAEAPARKLAPVPAGPPAVPNTPPQIPPMMIAASANHPHSRPPAAARRRAIANRSSVAALNSRSHRFDPIDLMWAQIVVKSSATPGQGQSRSRPVSIRIVHQLLRQEEHTSEPHAL